MRRRAAAVALVGLLTALAVVTAGRAQTAPTWSGTWRTDYGVMDLRESGSMVEGNYEHDAGHLTGTVSANTLTGNWDEAPTRAGPTDAGPFEFTLSGTLQSFDGKWRNASDADWTGGWTGTCTAGPCLKNGVAAPAPAPTAPRAPETPPSTPLPLASPAERPPLGELTSYAAPKPLDPIALFLPDFAEAVDRVDGTVSLARAKGPQIDDPDFAFGVLPSHENVGKALNLCVIIALSQSVFDTPGDQGTRFEGCLTVVSRILQRAEEIRARRPKSRVEPAQAGRCRVRAVPLRGFRGRSPIKVACVRTGTGVRLSIRPRGRGRSLRSAIGISPKLIVGRGRRASARPGDRLNVLWQAPSG